LAIGGIAFPSDTRNSLVVDRSVKQGDELYALPHHRRPREFQLESCRCLVVSPANWFTFHARMSLLAP
jgi:hypothetical protein